ncbi:protein ANTAGONIST OF LIKE HETEROCHROMATIN PROTEIN 1-like [Orbicella faveolata]|uniref:protein ANTAGONIST OF LIKE HETEROCHROMATIN PROTEIN 1-like n=1 Tax=Orbicella faveolata TaxID=48498 RepID=UPI0009E53085|nr:protein ANTAGONIST OF LIKE HETEROCHROMATIN PROTEIN 1-like [Orbicella faveolata]
MEINTIAYALFAGKASCDLTRVHGSRVHDLLPLRSNMLPRHIIACILVFFILEFVQLQQRQLLLLLCQWRLHLVRLQLILEYHNRLVRRRRRRPHPYYWNLPRPCNSWFEIHFHRRNIPEEFFYRQMRMSRDTFDTLLVTLRHKLQREDTRLRNCIPPEKVLAIGLYRLAHGGSFENAGIAMNVGKATAREAFTDVVNALYDFRNDFIKFPANKVETRASIETFAELSDLPNVAGAIDGTHIKIKAPKESAVDYFSRYQQHDVAVQGIVDGRKIFMDIAAGFPGSLHDARVLRNSSFYDRAEHGDVLAAPIHVIGGHEIQPYLVGDSAYPLSRWLQKPYPEGTRDPSEIQFNKQLSAARVKVE